MTIVDTLPKILKIQAEKFGAKKVAMRKKHLGIWKEYTWKDVYEHVKWISLGLIRIGLNRGDVIAIVGDADPRWFWTEFAAQAAGAIAIGIHKESQITELEYFFEQCNARFVFVQGQEEFDTISELKSQLAKIEKVVYWVAAGLEKYQDPILMSHDELENMGQRYEMEQPGIFEDFIDRGAGKDVALICFTPGTTRFLPKGITLSHDQLIMNASLWLKQDLWGNQSILYSYLPPVSAFEQIFGVSCALTAGLIICFPEGQDTADKDLREMGPHYLYGDGFFWEDHVSTILGNISKSSYIKKAIYDFFLPIGYRRAQDTMKGNRLSLLWWIAWLLANLLLFRPLRDKLGLSRLRSGYLGGSMVSPDCLRYFHAIGVNLKQVYSLAETGIITMHRDDDVQAETAGLPVEEGTLRISESREILFRSNRISSAYKDSVNVQMLIDDEGWLHTGDNGYLNENGHLVILGRSNHLLQFENGGVIPFDSIEAKLRFSLYIKHAFLVGGGNREFVSVLIWIRFVNVCSWAESQHIPYNTFMDLSQKTQVYDLIQEHIKRINQDLPTACRIVKFVNLHKEIDADEGELTRNGKLRKVFLEERYKDIITAIYKGEHEYLAETEVKYRDGRTVLLKTQIQIRTL